MENNSNLASINIALGSQMGEGTIVLLPEKNSEMSCEDGDMGDAPILISAKKFDEATDGKFNFGKIFNFCEKNNFSENFNFCGKFDFNVREFTSCEKFLSGREADMDGVQPENDSIKCGAPTACDSELNMPAAIDFLRNPETFQQLKEKLIFLHKEKFALRCVEELVDPATPSFVQDQESNELTGDGYRNYLIPNLKIHSPNVN
jgi:hypothetical protein